MTRPTPHTARAWLYQYGSPDADRLVDVTVIEAAEPVLIRPGTATAGAVWLKRVLCRVEGEAEPRMIAIERLVRDAAETNEENDHE